MRDYFRFRGLFQLFPIRLLLVHIKRNTLLAIVWVFLFGVVVQDWGRVMGMPYLFLDPEYQNAVSGLSMGILGAAFGTFSMAFHLTGYVLDGDKFKFLAAKKHPFLVYYLNNGLLPVAYLLVYGREFVLFQLATSTHSLPDILLHLACYLLGLVAVHGFVLLYFRVARHSFLPVINASLDEGLAKSTIYRVNVFRQVKNLREGRYIVSHYLNSHLHWVRAEVATANKLDIWGIFRRNHLLAVVLEFALILFLLLLGYLFDNQQSRVPAAASILMLLSLIALLAGAIGYWLRGWGLAAGIGALVLVNFLLSHRFIKADYFAPGIDYSCVRPDSSVATRPPSDMLVAADLARTQAILAKRLSAIGTGDTAPAKPKLAIVCLSGGGQRASLWAYRALQHANAQTNGALWQHTAIVLGASGGMLGAATYREMMLRKSTMGEQDAMFAALGKDMLNGVIFTYFSHDLPFRYKHYGFAGRRYPFDRGRAFDLQFHTNTSQLLNKPLGAYASPERQGHTPLLVLTPTVAADGRKLIIATTGLSFLCKGMAADLPGARSTVSAIELMRFYAGCKPMELDFISALRMNATFPYVMPNISLPSVPPMRVMDAGLSDNFGIANATKFIAAMQPWLEKNTSGVILLSIRDSPRGGFVAKKERQTLINQALNPIGSLYNNWAYLQEAQNDQLLAATKANCKVPIDYLTIEYNIGTGDSLRGDDGQIVKSKHLQERASLSWHLTAFEKENIYRGIFAGRNGDVIKRLKGLLSVDTAGMGANTKPTGPATRTY